MHACTCTYDTDVCVSTYRHSQDCECEQLHMRVHVAMHARAEVNRLVADSQVASPGATELSPPKGTTEKEGYGPHAPLR